MGLKVMPVPARCRISVAGRMAEEARNRIGISSWPRPAGTSLQLRQVRDVMRTRLDGPRHGGECLSLAERYGVAVPTGVQPVFQD